MSAERLTEEQFKAAEEVADAPYLASADYGHKIIKALVSELRARASQGRVDPLPSVAEEDIAGLEVISVYLDGTNKPKSADVIDRVVEAFRARALCASQSPVPSLSRLAAAWERCNNEEPGTERFNDARADVLQESFRLLKAHDQLPSPVPSAGEWRIVPPTQDGWFWVKETADDDERPVLVWQDGEGGPLVVGDEWDNRPVSSVGWIFWSVPITEPGQTVSPVPSWNYDMGAFPGSQSPVFITYRADSNGFIGVCHLHRGVWVEGNGYPPFAWMPAPPMPDLPSGEGDGWSKGMEDYPRGEDRPVYLAVKPFEGDRDVVIRKDRAEFPHSAAWNAFAWRYAEPTPAPALPSVPVEGEAQ